MEKKSQIGLLLVCSSGLGTAVVEYTWKLLFLMMMLILLLYLRTVMLAQPTDSGQLIASAVIKLLHAMQLQAQDLRGIGIQVQQLEGNRHPPPDSRGPRSCSIKEMLLGQGLAVRSNKNS